MNENDTWQKQTSLFKLHLFVQNPWTTSERSHAKNAHCNILRKETFTYHILVTLHFNYIQMLLFFNMRADVNCYGHLRSPR